MDDGFENWVVGRGIKLGLCHYWHCWLHCLPLALGLDVLGCWVDSFDLIVIRVQWQLVLGIARCSVSLQGGMCKTSSRGTVIVDAAHEYS